MDSDSTDMRKVTKKGKVNGFMDLRCHMSWLCWELLFSMLRMCCTYKGRSLNLELMLFGNYVVIMIMLMFIYVYMYVCTYVVSDSVIINHDYFYANAYMYAYCCLTVLLRIMLVEE